MKPLLRLTHPSSTGYIARSGDGLGSRLSFFLLDFYFLFGLHLGMLLIDHICKRLVAEQPQGFLRFSLVGCGVSCTLFLSLRLFGSYT